MADVIGDNYRGSLRKLLLRNNNIGQRGGKKLFEALVQYELYGRFRWRLFVDLFKNSLPETLSIDFVERFGDFVRIGDQYVMVDRLY